jgi:hypothetical protein
MGINKDHKKIEIKSNVNYINIITNIMGANKSKNITNTETKTEIYTCDLCSFETKYFETKYKYPVKHIHYIKVTIADIDIYYWNDPFDEKSNNHMLKLAIENYCKINEETTKQQFTNLVLTTICKIQQDKIQQDKLISLSFAMYNCVLAQLLILNT